jgi:hypothetical protein
MKHQHVENMLIRYRGDTVEIKTMSGATYDGAISDVTNDYVALKVKDETGAEEVMIVLLQSIESIRPRRN